MEVGSPSLVSRCGAECAPISQDTEFATVPTVPDLVKDLFGEKSEAFKISEEVSGSSGAGVSGSAAVSDLKDTVGYSSEYSADYCDVAIWWRAPEVVKARWGADSKSYKMAQAAADQVRGDLVGDLV